MIRRVVYPSKLSHFKIPSHGGVWYQPQVKLNVNHPHVTNVNQNRFFPIHSLSSSPQRRTLHTTPILIEEPLYITPPTHHYLSLEDRFVLNKEFIDTYKHRETPFGFNGLGEIVYRRTYSRVKPDTLENEQWFETVERVVNGCFNMQKNWIVTHHLGWDENEMQLIAQEMYDRIFEMKFLPPGRGLWAMGSPITEERGLYAALNNCAFVSTDKIAEDPSKPFSFLMDMAMLGVGVGFDTEGANTVSIRGQHGSDYIYVIPDSREGWVQSVKLLIDSFFNKDYGNVIFDYSLVREEGQPIKGFGGVSSGPTTLMELHNSIREILTQSIGKPLSITAIVDIMNCIGKCVISGNVRRTAEIAFGRHDSKEFIDLKNYEKNPHRKSYGWTSNNSVFAEIGMDYTDTAQRVAQNGEPGYAWLSNMRAYSRMNGDPDWKDWKANGGNPCLEQTLESYELCCLVETFPTKHKDLDDFKKTLRVAFLYAKTVTLGKTHWPNTNRVLLRNRRIGCSMSGIAQFLSKHSIEDLRQFCTEGYQALEIYDREFSNFFSIPRSIKMTSIKPSGTVSLLAGSTPGMHYPECRFYIRRLRLPKGSNLAHILKEAGYVVEEAHSDPRSLVVEFPIDAGEGIRTAKELSLWEQLSLAAFLQKYWADNQVSCTITFDPETEGGQIPYALNYYQYQLKGVSFLPRYEGVYSQMPYEAITEEVYKKAISRIKEFDLNKSHKGEEPESERYCDGDKCVL
jgi:ribonucleoside-triphosphate reductase